ncbi:LysE family translocator [Rhodococcus fascians]|jgi:threonine/homoserine/homoserine lactone efflux protein|uniref:LysE family translocator n=1 Tax=Rhodococcoides fascians TaxID=1828 RepID=UPI00050C0EF7|nr:LysE family translocator [Rhodococcus fascians]MBY3790862.1 LysE family translocator [Rhodococcus fascians]MBY3823558.1 LysE family translocator [Rhodococcus fascians]MBY3834080.1 LysE family translocator [Rhodococcus fascians]MBY3863293.1 LysE family translocator [Rhodococcus fascians]MBY3882763.1 LysE family translocator [Rhodococcus fascians]
MVSWSAVFGVFAVALVLVLTPGPNMIYLVSRSISQGRRAGMVSLVGVAVGFLVYLTATNLGLAAVFTAVPALYIAVKLAGAAYLGWLAVQALRGTVSAFEPTALQQDSNRRLFMMGLVTNLLNPKIAIMYISVIPQFVDPAAGPVLLQGFALGGVQIAVAVVINLAIVVLAGSIARFLAVRPTWLKVQRYLMGTVLGLLAVRVATDGGRPLPA